MLQLLSEFRMKMDPTLMTILEQLQELKMGIRQSGSQPGRTKRDIYASQDNLVAYQHTKKIYIPAKRN